MSNPSRTEIWKMFDSISHTYDKANRWMTLGLDRYWRKKMSRLVPSGQDLQILDCATGTGDQILSLLQNCPQITKAFGVDLSQEMLEIGKKKIQKTSFANQVHLQKASILSLPFADSTFDCITLSFGIRNVTDVELCLREIKRCLKPGGRALILETSLPKNPFIRNLHLFYIRNILPSIGGWVSKQKHAYEYLNKTAETFPYGQKFCDLMHSSGFIQVKCHPMTLGAISIYQGDKAHDC